MGKREVPEGTGATGPPASREPRAVAGRLPGHAGAAPETQWQAMQGPALSPVGSGSRAAAACGAEHCPQSWQAGRPQGVSCWDAGVKGPQSHGLSPHLHLQMDRLEGWEALPCSRVTQCRVPEGTILDNPL